MSDENPNLISRSPDGQYDGDLRVKQLFDIQAAVMYVGRAALGSSAAAAAWTIKKVVLDGAGNPVSTTWTSMTAVWDDRATETYS